MDLGRLVLEALVHLAYAGLVIGAALLPVLLVTRSELRRLGDPDHLRQSGVFVRNLAALDAVADVIGRYNGAEIYRFVVFKGMHYEFDHIVPPLLPREVHEKELLLEPGVVYVTA